MKANRVMYYVLLLAGPQYYRGYENPHFGTFTTRVGAEAIFRAASRASVYYAEWGYNWGSDEQQILGCNQTRVLTVTRIDKADTLPTLDFFLPCNGSTR